MSKQLNKSKSYSGYSFEDFLLDDFFRDSILNPTEESMAFWVNFQENNKEKLEDFLYAKRCMEDINRDFLDDNKIALMWENIQKKNRPVRRIGSIHFWRISIAAGIAVLLFFSIHIFFPRQNGNIGQTQLEQDIVAFANKHQPAGFEEAQLIVSDENIITLNESESEIVYDSTSIKTGSVELSKEKSSSFNQLIIPKGKRSVLTLSDGTKIWVNSGTRIIFPVSFEENKREIYVDGETYLDVCRDIRPFVVQTGSLSIHVLGTRFNVQAYSEDNRKQVVLESGSVKISLNNHNKEFLLNPEEMFECGVGEESVQKVNTDIYTSWIDGVYTYEKEALGVILKRLSRYYGKVIEVDHMSSELKCSGKLDLKDNLVEVLNIICFTAPVTYVNDDGKYLVTYKTKTPMNKDKE